MTSSDNALLGSPRPEHVSALKDHVAEPPPAWSPRLTAAVACLFLFFLAHDALQERAFRTPGFSFGWFMTLVEIAVVSACAAALEWQALDEALAPADATTLRRCVAALAVALAASQGSGSAALNYVNYPVKVAFKSSKLVPTMVFGAVLGGKKFAPLEYAAALLMCAALALLSLADFRGEDGDARDGLPLGCALLGLAVFADALVPNLQERVLRELRYPVGRMIVYSNAGCFVLVLAYCAGSGELRPALAWCGDQRAGAALLVAQACCSYAGLRAYLVVVKELSGVAGVVVTSLRKVLTLVLSFLLFEKPFSAAHAAAFALLAAGVGLASYARGRPR